LKERVLKGESKRGKPLKEKVLKGEFKRGFAPLQKNLPLPLIKGKGIGLIK
jgi:hypothetical protein